MLRLFKTITLTCLIVLAVVNSPARSHDEDPHAPMQRATVQSGQIEGLTSSNGVTGYLGIPYAAPPVGALRWRAPQSPIPWQGVRKSVDFGASCPQPLGPWAAADAEPVFQSEDCLFLNVWTPASSPDTKLPVMVWIHGGGFLVGSGSDPETSGKRLAAKGVVVVTLNYRLASLGFLVLDELETESVHGTSGNYGLLDQIAALRWVHDNIATFGGDPNNVTLFGFSAGSTSVSALQASPLARGLFHRAIGESTAQMNPAAGIWHLRTPAQAKAYGERFKTSFGARNLDELRAVPASDLVASPFVFWLIESDGYVLPGEVHDIFSRGEQATIPVLAGATKDEGTTLGSADVLQWLTPGNAHESNQFREIYGPNGANSLQSVHDVILWQMREWVHLNKLVEDKSYLYFFTQAPPQPPTGPELGAYHGAELPYVFQTLETHALPWGEEDRKLSDMMSNYWVNFARNGDPNGPSLPYWPTHREGRIMELSSSPGERKMPRQDALQVLDQYFSARREIPAE